MAFEDWEKEVKGESKGGFQKWKADVLGLPPAPDESPEQTAGRAAEALTLAADLEMPLDFTDNWFDEIVEQKGWLEAHPDPKDVPRYPQQQRATENRIGLIEQVQRMDFLDWAERAPFSLAGAGRNLELLMAIQRLQEGNYPYTQELIYPGFHDVELAALGPRIINKEVDGELVTQYLLKQQELADRGQTFAAKVFDGASYLPGWMIEFCLTGGLSKIGNETARQIGLKTLGGYAKTKAGQVVLRGAGWIGGAITRTSLGLPHRILEETLKRRLPQKFSFGPDGNIIIEIPGERWATALAKGWGAVVIEAASEETGEALTIALKTGVTKLPFGRKFVGHLEDAWRMLKPTNTRAAFIDRIFTRAGYSNIIGEVGEERLATILSAVAGTEDFGLGEDADMWQRLAEGMSRDIENLPVEAAVLSIPAGARYLIREGVSRIEKEKPYEAAKTKEGVTEPASSLEIQRGPGGRVVPQGEPTGTRDPTNYQEALEITEQHRYWMKAEGVVSPWIGIFDLKSGAVEYTPEQVDTAYRTVQKAVASPMPDAQLFAMPGKEAEVEAIGEKMKRLSKLARKPTRRPTLPKPKSLPKTKTSKADHIKAVYEAATKDETRYAINGVLVEGDTLVATDGRRMFWAKGKWGKDGLYLDAKSLKNGSLGKPDKTGKPFPKWQDILPDVSGKKVILVSELPALWRRVRQAAIMTSEEARGVVIIANKDGSLGFAGASPETGHVEINIQPGGRILGGVNPDYFLDAVAFHAKRGDASFEFYFSESDRPMLTRSLDGKTFTLTMPINLGEDRGRTEAIAKAIAEGKPAEAERKAESLADFINRRTEEYLAPRRQRLTELEAKLQDLETQGRRIETITRYPSKGQEKLAEEWLRLHKETVKAGSREFELALQKEYEALAPPAEAEKEPYLPSVEKAREPSKVAAPASLPKKIVSARQIIEHFERALKVPIRGKVTHKMARYLGWYSIRAVGIRQRDIRDLATAAHEVGHHVDHYFSIRTKTKEFRKGRRVYRVPKGTAEELTALGKKLYGKRKPPGGYRSEGVAEFIRMWLFGEDTKLAAPNFHRFFMEEYLPNNKALAEALRSAKGQIGTWLTQGAEARIESQISKTPIVGTVKERLAKSNLWLQAALVDEFVPLKKGLEEVGVEREKLPPAKDPYALAIYFASKEGGRARQMVLDGTIDLWGNKTGPSLKEIVKPVAADIERFTRWMVAYRAVNLHKRGIKSGISRGDAEYVFKQYDSPEWRKVADEVTQWNHRILGYVVQAGALEKAVAQKMKDLNPVYIPFMRAFAPGEKRAAPAGVGRGIATTAKAVHAIRGSGREIIDPFEAMITQTRRMLSIAHKTAVSRALIQLEATRRGMAKVIWEIPAPMRATKFSAEQIKRPLLKLAATKLGVDVSEIPDSAIMENWDDILTVYTNSPIFLGKENVVSVVIDGKRRFYEVSPELYRVLKGLDQIQLPKFLDLIVGKPARMLKLGATGVNAAFGLIRNPIRDSLQFIVTGKHAKFGPFSSLRGIALDITTTEAAKLTGLPEKEMARQFIGQGGKITGFIGMDRSSIKHLRGEMLASSVGRYAVQTARHPLDALRDLFSVPEAGPRVAEYEKALEKAEKKWGKDSPSAKVFAFNAAQDVTLNFTRHGWIGKWINQVIPFWNAGVQDISKIHRVFQDRPVEAALTAIGSLTLPSFALWWLYKDEDWYRNLPSYEKANYQHFRIPNTDTIVRIPVPFTIGHIFMSLPVTVVDAWYKQEPEQVKEVFADALRQDVPGNWPQWPAAVAPIIHVLMNKDWAGRPIVPRAVEKKLPEDQYREWNTKLCRVIGKALDISPAQLEYVVNAYSGGLYQRSVKTMETVFGYTEKEIVKADWPVIGTLFQRDPYAPKAQIARFYDKLDKLERIYQSKKEETAIDILFERHQYNQVARLLSYYWKELKEVKTEKERKELYGEIRYWVRDIAD